MKTSPSLQTYKMFRLSDFGTRTARDAFNRLKAEQTITALPYPVLSLEHNTCFEWKGFTIHIAVGYDDDPDYSWLGEFSNTPKEDAIRHEPENRRTKEYFNPATTVCEYQQQYSKQGYARHQSWLLAKTAVQNDYKMMLRYNESGSPIIEITANKQHIPLGAAEIGIADWDCVQETIIDYDLIEAAITDAELNLKQLCTCA
jgi:hypothetical protein